MAGVTMPCDSSGSLRVSPGSPTRTTCSRPPEFPSTASCCRHQKSFSRCSQRQTETPWSWWGTCLELRWNGFFDLPPAEPVWERWPIERDPKHLDCVPVSFVGLGPMHAVFVTVCCTACGKLTCVAARMAVCWVGTTASQ